MRKNFERTEETSGPELGGFKMGDLVLLPGETDARMIIAIDHQEKTFLLERTNHVYGDKRKKVPLEELLLWKKLNKQKK